MKIETVNPKEITRAKNTIKKMARYLLNAHSDSDCDGNPNEKCCFTTKQWDKLFNLGITLDTGYEVIAEKRGEL